MNRITQKGFSLVELMVAVAIAMFLLGGLVTIVQHNRTTSMMQTQLAQLQDSERLAMTVLSNVAETAGYFPNPLVNTAVGAIKTGAGSAFPTAGTPAIIGTSGFNAQGDSFTVRYGVGAVDNVFNCQGTQNTTGALDTWENTFYVDPNGNLVCVLWMASNPNALTPPVTLVSGLVKGGAPTQSFTVVYGVQMNNTGNGTCTDTYMTAAQVRAANGGAGAWGNVCSVAVTLTFYDLTNCPGWPAVPCPAGTKTLPITRTIALMQTAGPV
ncbi:MAG: prepilin-type N-terminal cleavage/methylation domain-containing protein [Proteobacteria bacterium]|nr:prepilin-type N-terminal cleavage/methylation domain-containing protein [Pseudomonadota bacterium]